MSDFTVDETATPASIRVSLFNSTTGSLPFRCAVRFAVAWLTSHVGRRGDHSGSRAGRKPLSDNDKVLVHLVRSRAGINLKVMGNPARDGRFFAPEDTETAPHIAVIDQISPRSFFPGEDPSGKRSWTTMLADENCWRGPPRESNGLDDKLAIHAEFYFRFAKFRTNYMSRPSAAPPSLLAN